MPSTCSEDEFDALPDLFGNIDWDSANIAGLESVPPVPPQSSPPMPSSSQPTVQPTRTFSSTTIISDADHNTDSHHISDVDMNCGDPDAGSVLETPGGDEEGVGEGGRAATPSSSYSYSFDSIDDDFLKEVDAFEAGFRAERVVEHEAGASSTRIDAVDGSAPPAAGSSLSSSRPSSFVDRFAPRTPPQGDQRLVSSRFFHASPPSPGPRLPGAKTRTSASSPKKDSSVPLDRPNDLGREEATQTVASTHEHQPERRYRKRARTSDAHSSSPQSSLPMKRSKGKEKEMPLSQGSQGRIRSLLQGFEDNMTCPICFDLFSVPHLGNPCGHSFCGLCGMGWIKENRTCPMCRAKLNKQVPMIPNISLDNTIERHINALAASGDRDWLEGGEKMVEWNERRENWKTEKAALEKAPSRHKARKPASNSASRSGSRTNTPAPAVAPGPQARHLEADDSFIVPDDYEEHDEDYEGSDEDHDHGGGDTEDDSQGGVVNVGSRYRCNGTLGPARPHAKRIQSGRKLPPFPDPEYGFTEWNNLELVIVRKSTYSCRLSCACDQGVCQPSEYSSSSSDTLVPPQTPPSLYQFPLPPSPRLVCS
ncbi:uncharacterized protein STEHIDRAFT_160046 [Stereum hirsutum FP-91666 SS1]|uniref:uncharacterized protein n=1 Tax=Stereum hirsutum (strain FP-91666) TaxID=721885 RepID=UPI0004449B82|nr:uncharacterized protein STEHIDRAFT_160046 [Stereum hirsutum FP-91666 SS1]EIM83464.1 hypothetical protein STEHIDRAFT_160046 [Stereum hirsutum FP-91666 SS1]